MGARYGAAVEPKAHQSIKLTDAMVPHMRTTVSLDPDARALVERRMRERGQSFKQALNDAIRAGALAERPRASATRPVSMGRPRIDLDRALRIADQLDDDERIAAMRAGS
jgi:hypothetical protein